MCTPGMGVNLWGESPLYVNRLSELVLSPPKGDPHSRWCGEGELEALLYPIGPLS